MSRHAMSGLIMAARLRALQETASQAEVRKAQHAATTAADALDAAQLRESAALDGWRTAVTADRLDLERLVNWGALAEQEGAQTADARRDCDACSQRLESAHDDWGTARRRTSLAEERLTDARRAAARRSDERAMSDATELHLLLRHGVSDAY